MEASPVILTVLNTLSANNMTQAEGSGGESYLFHFNLTPISSGSYSLRLDYSRGTKFIRFIVR
jgi:hypothetical protein